MMTKLFAVLVVLAVVLMSMCATAETYALTTIVVSLDYDNDVVEVQDFNGNVWAFDGCEDWQLMDICSMCMNNNDTQTIYDDTIVSTHYNGWLERWLESV